MPWMNGSLNHYVGSESGRQQ